MARPKRRNTHLELLESLETWSIHHGLGEDPYIQKLSKVILENRKFSYLASSSAVDHLPTPKIKGGRVNLLFSLVLLRNILIFLPVGLTWLAISQAAIAFNVFAKNNPKSIVNFLTFWQDGYGVLDSKWKLSHVAILDAVIMLLVIVLVFITTLLSKLNNQSLSRERNAIERERMSLALRIDEHLESKKAISNVSFNNEVARIVYNLRSASESLYDATSNLNKSIKEFIREEQRANNARIRQDKTS